jgi:hypothetical protein
MPAIFTRDKPASLSTVLDGDTARQKEALWSYFMLGKDAPGPKPPPPMPVPSPGTGEPPPWAQIPVRLPDGKTLEGLCVLFSTHDLVACDLGAATLRGVYTGARIVRGAQGRLRTFTVDGTPVGIGPADAPLRLIGPGKAEIPEGRTLHGYDRLADGARLRWQVRFASGTVEVAETRAGPGRQAPAAPRTAVHRCPGGASVESGDVLKPDARGSAATTVAYELPETKKPPPSSEPSWPTGKLPGSLERPGYRASRIRGRKPSRARIASCPGPSPWIRAAGVSSWRR